MHQTPHIRVRPSSALSAAALGSSIDSTSGPIQDPNGTYLEQAALMRKKAKMMKADTALSTHMNDSGETNID
ncbi:hypothetical protein [Sphingomonas sp. ABOLH]|uniref:hypothetical protein n=1 Tax=Sphingomonas sp. ABOLH TaxID=1985881 RepID=UPI000F7ECCED|nr:hypothetical protein [Sphingomonas sp. ABOLH]